MANLVEQFITVVFGKSGGEFLENVTRGMAQSVDRLYDFAYVKVLGLPFVVLGARQTGKTTLIEWLRRNVHVIGDFQPAPTAPGGDAVGAFGSNVGDEFVRLNPRRDVGGEYEMWDTDWLDLFVETRPRGIIFMIDHTDVLKHKDALNFVMNMIEEHPDARANLRSVLVLVNKSDLWSSTTTLDKLMSYYANEIKRLRNQGERLGYKSLIQSCSVISGVGVDDAMQTFFNLIRPNPRRTVTR
jgi:hypothetical protein